MIVKEQKPIEFYLEKPVKIRVHRPTLAKAIIWYTDKPVAQKKKVFRYGNYFAIAVHGEKLHIHRLLMMYRLRRRLATNEYVHHRNERKWDNSAKNLQLLPASVHQSITNKGRKFTEEHRQRIADANRRRKGIKYKIYEKPELIINNAKQ